MQARRSGAMWPSRASGQRRRICVEIYESSFADSTNKKQVHPELKCDSEEQQDHECVTKLGVLHRQAKQTLLDEMLEQFTAPPSPGSPFSPHPPQTPLLFLHLHSLIAKYHLVSRHSGQVMFESYVCKN